MSDGDSSGAGDDLASPPQVGEADSGTVTVPMDLLQGCKVGDTYTVKSTDNGEVTLSKGASDDMADWENDAKEAMTNAK